MTNKRYQEIEDIDASTYAGRAANACRVKARGILGDDLLNFALMDFVAFMMLNTKFMDRGIFITEDNKEEAYIKVIETGDDSLINDLERYINLQDKILVLDGKKREFETVIHQLQGLDDYNDVDAVNTIVRDYLRK